MAGSTNAVLAILEKVSWLICCHLDLSRPQPTLLLSQISSKDKDFRYMATSDLLNLLQQDNFKVDSENERRLSAALLTQLEDPSGDISGLAVKWWVSLDGVFPLRSVVHGFQSVPEGSKLGFSLTHAYPALMVVL